MRQICTRSNYSRKCVERGKGVCTACAHHERRISKGGLYQVEEFTLAVCLRSFTVAFCIRSDLCVDGTKYPPKLAAIPIRCPGLAVTGCTLADDARLWCPTVGEETLGVGAGEVTGAPITWTSACVSILCISIVPLGRRVVMCG
jgi:hypothetical protein